MKKTNKGTFESIQSFSFVAVVSLLLSGCFEINLKDNDALNSSIESLDGQIEYAGDSNSQTKVNGTEENTNASHDDDGINEKTTEYIYEDVSPYHDDKYCGENSEKHADYNERSQTDSHQYSNKRSYLIDFSYNPSLIEEKTNRLSDWIQTIYYGDDKDDDEHQDKVTHEETTDALYDEEENSEVTDENYQEVTDTNDDESEDGFELPPEPIDARFPDQYDCSTSVILMAESMSTTMFESLCTSLNEKATLFHDRMQTNYQVVDDDYNDRLEIRIFNSYASYVKKIKDVSGLDFTTSGGFFYEGNPMFEGNVAKIYVFEKSLSNGVWNLDHEFIHYLNGRYIKYGGVSTKANYLFWEEGIAEYFANPEGDGDTQFALINPFTIADILSIDSDDGQTKIYGWSYWLMRYLIEEQSDTTYTLSYHLTQGQFEEYETLLEEISLDFEDDFQGWLEEFE